LDLQVQLLEVDPAEEIFSAHALEEGGMVRGHMPADRGDEFVVIVSPGDEPAFASDDPGHRVLLRKMYALAVDRMLA